MSEGLFFFFLLLFSLLCQGFFTMTEMAFVTFNRVRLAYFVEKQEQGAILIQRFLDKPITLFGTTLIGVNFFLQLGSECSRRVFISWNLDPDYAYVPQLFIVLLFAELIPMLAARDHSEHLAMKVVRVVRFLSYLLMPLIFIIDAMGKGVSYLLKSPLRVNTSLSRDELKSLLKDSESNPIEQEKEGLEPLIDNIFSLKNKVPADLLIPIEKVSCVNYHATVGDARRYLEKEGAKYIPLYHERKENIYGIVYSQDLLNLSDSSFVKDVARSPWFVVETNSIFQVINQFRKNNQKLAVVLDSNGVVTGILTLSTLVDEIFSGILFHEDYPLNDTSLYVNKTFPIDTKISQLLKYKVSLSEENVLTLEELMAKRLGNPPKDQDIAVIKGFQLIYEGSAFSEKKIRVKSSS